MGNINIPNLTGPLEWQNQPTGWDWSEDHLTITSRARTDWFIDPGSGDTFHSAPALLFSVSAPCILRALVTVQHIATFDAGALVVFESPHSWGKLALERSPQGKLTVVSVVTKEVSDDCNAFSVDGPAYLRVSKLAQAYAFHFSHNGQDWSLIRYFKLLDHPNPRVGFLAQSPAGEGCTARFMEIRFEDRLLSDIRSGE